MNVTWKSSKVQNIGEDEDEEQSVTVTVSYSVGDVLCTDTVQLRATVLVSYMRIFLSGRLNVINSFLRLKNTSASHLWESF